MADAPVLSQIRRRGIRSLVTLQIHRNLYCRKQTKLFVATPETTCVFICDGKSLLRNKNYVKFNDTSFERSPTTKEIRVQSLVGSPDFRKWKSCRAIPLVGGFSRGSPISPAPSFRRRSMFTSITLIGSQDLVVKSRPNLFTHALSAQRAALLVVTKACRRTPSRGLTVLGAWHERTKPEDWVSPERTILLNSSFSRVFLACCNQDLDNQRGLLVCGADSLLGTPEFREKISAHSFQYPTDVPAVLYSLLVACRSEDIFPLDWPIRISGFELKCYEIQLVENYFREDRVSLLIAPGGAPPTWTWDLHRGVNMPGYWAGNAMWLPSMPVPNGTLASPSGEVPEGADPQCGVVPWIATVGSGGTGTKIVQIMDMEALKVVSCNTSKYRVQEGSLSTARSVPVDIYGNVGVPEWLPTATCIFELNAVLDKVSTFESNLRKTSLLIPAYILTGSLSDTRPPKHFFSPTTPGTLSSEKGSQNRASPSHRPLLRRQLRVDLQATLTLELTTVECRCPPYQLSWSLVRDVRISSRDVPQNARSHAEASTLFTKVSFVLASLSFTCSLYREQPLLALTIRVKEVKGIPQTRLVTVKTDTGALMCAVPIIHITHVHVFAFVGTVTIRLQFNVSLPSRSFCSSENLEREELMDSDSPGIRQQWFPRKEREETDEMGDPRESTPAGCIVWQDSHMRKSGVDWSGFEPLFTLVGDEQSRHSAAMAPGSPMTSHDARCMHLAQDIKFSRKVGISRKFGTRLASCETCFTTGTPHLSPEQRPRTYECRGKTAPRIANSCRSRSPTRGWKPIHQPAAQQAVATIRHMSMGKHHSG
ncbi:hypothetical protein PR048_020535 [Dryococelus australis]|uniref:Uncharacterized protein n=1 Tax=Dryococelus australis TaxID=614101 RepID=A0ABQ9H6J3_9NEOP|nr:hypothetical protein PR048_020535 [Dryococelus australis]